jgi:hypothetical protein
MDQQVVRSSLVSVLRKIQSDGGYGDADIIVGETVPLDDLDGFDSKLAPVAIKRLARSLGITIPKDRNIFREGGRSSGRKLTIDEISASIAASATTDTGAPGTAA